MLVLLERDNFCVNSAISLTSYAVVCSNVVVHNSDHNARYGRYCGLLQHWLQCICVFISSSSSSNYARLKGRLASAPRFDFLTDFQSQSGLGDSADAD